jgi:hypothetical protein
MTDVTLDDAAFDDLYARVLEPALAPHEAERRRLVARFWRWATLGGVAGACVGIPLLILSSDGDGFQLGLFIALGIGGLAYWPLMKFQKRCKAEALTALAQALGMTYQCEDFSPPRLGHLSEFGLTDSWDRSSWEDLFEGTRAGCRFALYEASMTTGSGKNQRTVFRGQVIRIAFPKTFLGTTVVGRDNVRRWRFGGPKLEKVRLESSQFERIFEVRGTDQVEARYLVHPVFMEKLLAVEAAGSGRNIRCVFDDGDLIIAIDGGDLFEIVHVFKPLPDRDHTRKGVRQIAEVLALIDAVMAPPPPVYG